MWEGFGSFLGSPKRTPKVKTAGRSERSTRMTTYTYTTLFYRMLNAAERLKVNNERLKARRAAVIGKFWADWASKQEFGEKRDF
jgi:hypothetical protein